MSLKRRLTIVDADDGDKHFIQTALKVAFASTDMETVNQHFGSASSFSIYVFDSHRIKLFEVIQFGEMKQDGNEDKLLAKLDALEGCIAVYSQAIGASAITQLKARNTQPIKVVAGTCIVGLIESLQDALRSGPGGWLANAMQKQKLDDPGRFDDMEADGWHE